MYARFVDAFWLNRGVGAGFAEWANGADRGADADSGPILFGIGFAASGFGVAAANALDDQERVDTLLGSLDNVSDLLGLYATLNPSSPYDLLQLSPEYTTGFYLGDALLFFALTWEPWLPFAIGPLPTLTTGPTVFLQPGGTMETHAKSRETLARLAKDTLLGPFLHNLVAYDVEHQAHWQQGEFHHDHVLRLRTPPPELGGGLLVVSTNCNAGIKEVLYVAEPPTRWALWKRRCPDNPEFDGEVQVLASVRTSHWFDPCELLRDDARSELRPEFRRRQRGGGWRAVGDDPALD